MRTRLAALRGALRRPGPRDAGLAALLLVSTWVVFGAATPAMISGPLAGADWLWDPVAGWVLVGVCVAAVAVRRRWPVAALAVAALAVLIRMALAAGPVPADLAVPVILYTIAAQRRRAVSLALLGAALTVVAAWSVFVALDGSVPAFEGPLRGGQELRQEGPIPVGPTDWGGLPVLGSVLVGAWAVGWAVRSRRAYLGELVARARDLERERDQQAQLAVAAERARIAREVHDVVAHGLAVIVMQAQGGAAAFDRRPADTRAALDTIVTTGRASLADLRHVLSGSGQTDDPARPVPGLGQLPRLVDQVRQAGTPVELHVNGSPRPLPAGVDVSSYRIIQEALTNTMKHAGPGARAHVVVSYGGDELTIDASDDGAGDPTSGATGNGLRGMRERAALLGGEVEAGPGPDGGYAVRARIPLEREATA
jgi:signal transduction histidine kinase